MSYCFLNGKILPVSEAKVGIFDIGILRGFGIYEAMTTFNNKIFMFEDHVRRFRKSAEFLHVTVPNTDKEIEKVIYELLEKNQLQDKRANIKLILTGGEAVDGINFDPTTPTFYIFVEECRVLGPGYYENGANLLVHEYLRQYPEYKTTNYITAVSLQKDRKVAGAIEILYTCQGAVLECSTSNFFIVKDGKLITAKDNILRGVTRNVTIDLARKFGFEVEERAVSVVEMYEADECFLTSSFKDIVPIVKVDNRSIGNGEVGKITKRLIGIFTDFASTY
jgi:branched-chain amino acid aminotransferase